MKCIICKTDKLSKEFPQDNISEDCEHPASCCLRCMIKHFQSTLKCPYANCENKVSDGATTWKQFQTELDQLYPPVQALDIKEEEFQADVTQTGKFINVTTLAGDMASFAYSPQMTIKSLKEAILERMKVAVDKQQLMYKDDVLETYKNQTEMKLNDYKVPPSATIHLMILLYAIPQNFNHVVFDLFWGYPPPKKSVHTFLTNFLTKGRDYLDATCLIFAGKSCVAHVDYGNCDYSSKAICHSGDVMDDTKRIGHHTIEVRLKNIPPNVTHLYFTLSAWDSPTIAHFPNPSLKFFEASNREKDLCKTTFGHAHNSQAVVMCSVWRSADGQWRIFESGKLSAGNAKDYKPLISTICQMH